ncbi:MAG: AMP-binding protein, partial [Pseudomonadales bacterium]
MYPGQHPGEKIAYQMAGSGKCVTYAELEADSNRIAHLFRNEGLVPEDGIAILLPNHETFLKIAWGAQRSGLYFTPISTLFQRDEIDYILTNSDARVLITNLEYIGRVSAPVLAGLRVFIVGSSHSNWPALEDAMANFPVTPVAGECEGAEMIYSSGTTGQPKGVRFPLARAPLGTVSALFKTRVELHSIDAGARYLSTAPLYHSAPLRYNMMVTRLGGSAVIMEKFDAEHALALIERHKVTHSQWVPTMFVRLLKLPEEIRSAYDVSSLRFVIHAAAPCPIEIKQQMIDWFGPKLYEYYSGTEANGSTAIDSTQWLTHRGSVGR